MSAKASATGRIPVIELPAEAFGTLGVTVGELPDAGGGNGQAMGVIPIRVVKWMDERQTCVRVLAFVHHDDAPDLAGCALYRAGLCRMGQDMPCAFHEPLTAEVWQKARDWQMIDGCAVHRDLWPLYGMTPSPSGATR